MMRVLIMLIGTGLLTGLLVAALMSELFERVMNALP